VVRELLPQLPVMADSLRQLPQGRQPFAAGKAPQAPHHLPLFVGAQIQPGHVPQRPLKVKVFLSCLLVLDERLQQPASSSAWACRRAGPQAPAGWHPSTRRFHAAPQQRAPTKAARACAISGRGLTASASPISATARGMPLTPLVAS